MPTVASVVLERLINRLLLTYRLVWDLDFMLAIQFDENTVYSDFLSSSLVLKLTITALLS